MNEVECSGFEKSITECLFNKESLGCSHEEDAAVRCNVPAMGFQERVSLSCVSTTVTFKQEERPFFNDDSWTTLIITDQQNVVGLVFNLFSLRFYVLSSASVGGVIPMRAV